VKTMSETQKQNIVDINNMIYKLGNRELEAIKRIAEKMIDTKLLLLVPDAILDNMDITEKLMLIDYYSKNEEKRNQLEEDTIPFEEILKEEGIDYKDL